MPKYTPGPWAQAHRVYSYDKATNDPLYATQVFDNAGETIATLDWHISSRKNGTHTDRDANARLIAAAPELLEACKAALGAFENNNAIDWNKLSDAIAKAEGNE